MKLKYITLFCVGLLLPCSAWAQINLDERETSAVSTVTEEELEKNSTPNPYDVLYGLLPGLTTLQRVDWGTNPQLILRGSESPLILVDGYERSLEYLSTVEIASVKVLKDGPATVLYGPRGSKGVVLITTKRGKADSREISANYNHGLGFPTNMPEMADGYTYALARNEALYYDGLPLEYTPAMLDALRNGTYPDLFPNTDWLGEAFRNHTVSNQLDFTFSGGGKKVRYFTALSYKNDFGILNTDYTKRERYNSQMRKYDLNLRMNIDVDLTPTTLVQWTMFGSIKERTRPAEYPSTFIPALFSTPSAAYPVRTSSGKWGGDLVHSQNPVALMADKGYFKENPRVLQADLRIAQDLSSLTQGLSAEVAIAYDNYASYKEQGDKTFAYEVNTPVENVVTGGDFETVSQIYGTDGALKVNCWGMTDQYVRAEVSAKALYDRSFAKHNLNASAGWNMEYYSKLGRNNTDKRLTYALTAGYSYDDRYMLDAAVACVGTSRLPEDRYRIYPAVAIAWNVAKESFMEDVIDVVDYLKLRASWGQNGNDNIDYELADQYWISNSGYSFGDGNGIGGSGMSEGTLPVENLTLERVNKYNVGVDMRFYKKLSLTADYYIHNYRNALIGAGNFYSSVLGIGVPQLNMGAYDRKGFEVALEWNDRVNKDFRYYVGANVSQAKTKVIENGEGFKEYPWMSAKVYPIGQIFGYEAIGYFRDEEDIANSPEQKFSEVRPGDIKYKDMNGDGMIDSRDVHAIGHSGSIPEWYGGLKLGFEYKGFGIDLLFQGTAGWTQQLSAGSIYRPMMNNSNISMWYLEDKIRWTEDTKGLAELPRLSTLNNTNNTQTSTQWLVSGDYLKLRNANIYYNLPKKWIAPVKMESCQIYVRGNNLFSIDHVPYLNCENMSMNYPDMFSVYAGVNIKF